MFFRTVQFRISTAESVSTAMPRARFSSAVHSITVLLRLPSSSAIPMSQLRAWLNETKQLSHAKAARPVSQSVSRTLRTWTFSRGTSGSAVTRIPVEPAVSRPSTRWPWPSSRTSELWMSIATGQPESTISAPIT
ncbi:hypothetical protein DSECCO2_378080 [anaerobic digester metagenome]